MSTNKDFIKYELLEKLQLSSNVITDIDLSGNIQIDVDDDLSKTSENPVQNKIVTKALDSKLNVEDNIIDLVLTPKSFNPIANDAVYNSIENLTSRIRELEVLNGLKLTYITNLEVFPTLNVIEAGTVSDKQASIARLFKDTNKWKSSVSYPSGTIVTTYDSAYTYGKIYKATQDVVAGTELTNTDYWTEITDTYIHKDETTGNYYHKYITEVPQSTVQVIKFKSIVGPTSQTTSINWGDESETVFLYSAEEKVDGIELGTEHPIVYEQDENGYIYSCWHDYADALTTSGLTSKYYTISILGNKFSSLSSDKNYNIMSSIFGNNQQFQMDCYDIEGLLAGSKKLLYVDCSDYNNIILQIFNIKSLFEDCINLQYAVGFYELTGINTLLSMERMFANCTNLLNCDVRIAKSIAVANIDTGNSEVYLNCENMSSSLRLLLPSNGFDSRIVTLNSTFKNCKNIHLNSNTDNSEPSDTSLVNTILFNDDSKIFEVTKPFEGCQLIDGVVPQTTENAYGYWK